MSNRAGDLHRRILTLDTHLDAPVHFPRPGWSFADRHLLEHDVAQVDLPRMEDGNLGGGFFVIYTAQGPLTTQGYAEALASARRVSDDIEAMLAQCRERIRAASTAADARRLHREGRLVAFKSIENSYCIGEDLSLVGEFHRRGVRLAGPVHSRNNQLADSATDEPHWNGLSPLGHQWVAEMNRVGTVIDGSHASNAAFDQMLAESKTPLLLSHTGSRSAFDTERNIDDARLRALVDRGGVIGFTTIFLSDLNLGPERRAAFGKFHDLRNMSPIEQRELADEWNVLNRSDPMWAADFDRFIDVLLRVIDIAGVEHVCFGADWDGGGGISGLEDVTRLPKITERLMAKGFSDDNLEKMWSGNVLRVLDAAQRVAAPIDFDRVLAITAGKYVSVLQRRQPQTQVLGNIVHDHPTH